MRFISLDLLETLLPVCGASAKDVRPVGCDGLTDEYQALAWAATPTIFAQNVQPAAVRDKTRPPPSSAQMADLSTANLGSSSGEQCVDAKQQVDFVKEAGEETDCGEEDAADCSERHLSDVKAGADAQQPETTQLYCPKMRRQEELPKKIAVSSFRKGGIDIHRSASTRDSPPNGSDPVAISNFSANFPVCSQSAFISPLLNNLYTDFYPTVCSISCLHSPHR